MGLQNEEFCCLYVELLLYYIFICLIVLSNYEYIVFLMIVPMFNWSLIISFLDKILKFDPGVSIHKSNPQSFLIRCKDYHQTLSWMYFCGYQVVQISQSGGRKFILNTFPNKSPQNTCV